MGWTDIAAGAVDAGSPATASLALQFRDNSEYNFDHQLRGGTFTVPVRLVAARAGNDFALSGTGTSVDLTFALDWLGADNTDDSRPDLATAPIVILQVKEDFTVAAYKDDWAENNVTVDRCYIPHGTLSADGCTVNLSLSAASSVDVTARIDFLIIGTPNAEDAYTVIAGTDTDQDSPLEEDLTQALTANQSYNKYHAIRCGTNTNGTRLAIARGKSAFTMNGVSAYDFIEVVFATDAIDGDPNFLSTPTVLLSLEEDKTAADDWDTNDAIVKRLHLSLTDEGDDVYTTVTKDKFFYSLQVNDGVAGNDFAGYVHWVAIGPVAAGE